MPQIPVTLRNFTDLENETRIMDISWAELVRGAVTVGHPNWRRVFGYWPTSAFDALRRVFTLKSAIGQQGNAFAGTRLWLDSDPSEQRIFSYCVGSSVCGAIAYRIANVPWLMSLDVHGEEYDPDFYEGRERPDFFGQTPTGDWWVFESKGSRIPPPARLVSHAKSQSRMVSHINQNAVACGLASIAYLDAHRHLSVIWDDPPPEEEGLRLPIAMDLFWRIHYSPIIQLIGPARNRIGDETRHLAFLPELDLYMGIDNSIREALQAGNYGAILRFAREFPERFPRIENQDTTKYFADGVILKLGPSWSTE